MKHQIKLRQELSNLFISFILKLLAETFSHNRKEKKNIWHLRQLWHFCSADACCHATPTLKESACIHAPLRDKQLSRTQQRLRVMQNLTAWQPGSVSVSVPLLHSTVGRFCFFLHNLTHEDYELLSKYRGVEFSRTLSFPMHSLVCQSLCLNTKDLTLL